MSFWSTLSKCCSDSAVIVVIVRDSLEFKVRARIRVGVITIGGHRVRVRCNSNPNPNPNPNSNPYTQVEAILRAPMTARHIAMAVVDMCARDGSSRLFQGAAAAWISGERRTLLTSLLSCDQRSVLHYARTDPNPNPNWCYIIPKQTLTLTLIGVTLYRNRP